ncbi:hypothetical protein SAMN04488542_11013 [Fontibacillus panacisegetis]|uniref:Peptidase propeptide and YPEB domain-containing protein n=1 Tax=Fontibacillus panacisegetis TaxID=670482 RepID=A0A1G7KNC3_9BACL|nr:hypothetical protein [Fontibacillus panacisegetis]SDF38733.1 hypothetical protein SAMN04488542_11013 [Fontibacillus panacisegetis]
MQWTNIMKAIIIIISYLAVVGCSVSSSITDFPSKLPTKYELQPESEVSTQNEPAMLSEEEALQLVESKLGKEALKISSLNLYETDEDGNYIVTQSSKATTSVMEWYHVNPFTQEIVCELLGGNCLEGDDLPENEIVELTTEQEQGLALAKTYASTYLSKNGYVEDLTLVEFDHEDNENLVYHVYNPGSGGTDTIDWLTVDINEGTVVSMFE